MVPKKAWKKHNEVPLSDKWPIICEIYTSKSLERFIFTISGSKYIDTQNVLSIYDIANNQWTKSFSLASELGLVHNFGTLSLISCHQMSGMTQFQYKAIEFKKNEWVWKDPIVKNVDFILGNISVVDFQVVEFLQRNWK